jgi:type I restriction enzyme M protein
MDQYITDAVAKLAFETQQEKQTMNHAAHNKLVSFIWSIADDCLRDVYVRGKYRDVILPMVVLRRLDTLLEPTKNTVLQEVQYQKKEMGTTELDEEPLRQASGYVFYNTSKWTLLSLHSTATNNRQILLANVEDSAGDDHLRSRLR